MCKYRFRQNTNNHLVCISNICEYLVCLQLHNHFQQWLLPPRFTVARLKFAVKTTHFIICSCAPFDYKTKLTQGQKKLSTPLNFRSTLRKNEKSECLSKKNLFHSLYIFFIYILEGKQQILTVVNQPFFFWHSYFRSDSNDQ